MDKKVAIFAGNHCIPEKQDYYFGIAHKLGGLLAAAGFAVVTGAGDGLMEAAARGAHEAGGQTIGIGLNLEGRSQSPYVKEYQLFDALALRQNKIIEIADAFIALPGGIGTAYEIFNILALKRTKELPEQKPLVLLGEYYKPISDLLEHMVALGFADAGVQKLYVLTDSIEQAVNYIKQKI